MSVERTLAWWQIPCADGGYGAGERPSKYEPRVTPDELERRKDLTRLAHAERRPGETIAAAVSRLGE